MRQVVGNEQFRRLDNRARTEKITIVCLSEWMSVHTSILNCIWFHSIPSLFSLHFFTLLHWLLRWKRKRERKREVCFTETELAGPAAADFISLISVCLWRVPVRSKIMTFLHSATISSLPPAALLFWLLLCCVLFSIVFLIPCFSSVCLCVCVCQWTLICLLLVY